MTTNSPNPVDGDVQALIADCQAEIAELEKVLAIDEYAAISHLQSKLRRQQVALAALTAEPEYNVSFEGGEIRLDVTKAEYNGRHPDYRWISYTTPPAQLLRPVELPKRKSMLTREEIDEDYTTCMAVPLDEVIAALETAGVPYEVKS